MFINPVVWSSLQAVYDYSVSFSSGRIDRKIEFPLPDEKTKRRIFQIHTSRMTVADDVTLDDLILAKDDLSGADIKVRARLSTDSCKLVFPSDHIWSATLFLRFERSL